MLIKYFDATIEYAEVEHTPCTGDSCSMVKTASEGSLLDDIKQKPGHAYLHVIAMGAGDYYSSNNNGDFFYEKDLLSYFKTFETAGVFVQHFNKDPDKSIGKVLKAIYNNDMHRVELAIEISEKKSPEFYNRIKSGERIKVSMGVKVPSEMCSYCGAITKGSLANRCEHLKFRMHDIMPNGQKVYAINMPPMNFFDISIVRKPADLQGYALFQKVASLNNNGNMDINEDIVMDKVAELVKYMDAMDVLPNGVSPDELQNLKEAIPKDKIVRIIATKRIILRPSEAMVLGTDMPIERLDEAQQYCDTPAFIELLLKHLALRGGFDTFNKYASLDYTNKTIDKLVARSILVKEASSYIDREDVFGNKRRDRPTLRKQRDLHTTKYPEYRVVFQDGKVISVRHSPLSSKGIPQYYLDLVDAGLASHIVGITVTGDERLLYRGDR